MPIRPCANYLNYRTELETMDEILQRSGLDGFVLEQVLAQREKESKDDKAYHRGLLSFMCNTRSAFRISILRAHKKCASVRDLEITLADSPLEQWFCYLENFDQTKAPSKSSIDRAKNVFTPEIMDQAAAMLLQKAASAPDTDDSTMEKAMNLLGFEMPVNLVEVWYDSTCHSPNIHFPVDWVQLGDCCRTLLKAIRTIRRHGIKNRMQKGGVDKLLHDLNVLNIAMANARRRKDSKKLRKKILRSMKKFADRMALHARTHRDLLEENRSTYTNLTPGKAAHILSQINHVLDLLPKAKKQAHERIIGERRVANEDKILSIYEPAVKVIKRGKSGSEVEYGNQLLIGENRDGLIIHWELFEDVRSDSGRLIDAIEKTEKIIGAKLERVTGDRGFSDEKTEIQLATERPDLINHVCPRSIEKMKEKKMDPEFGRSQTRRAQTEARIAILTNSYQRGRSLSKGLNSQRQELRWVMLSHNLRKLASKLIAEREANQAAAAQRVA